MRYFSRGFTILELLVAIAIVGVLASITGVAVIGFTDEAESSNIIVELRQTPNLAATYRGDASNDGYSNFCSSTDIASVISDHGATCVDGTNGYIIHLVTTGTNQLCISSNTYGKVVKTTIANIDTNAFSCGSAILSSNSGGGGGNTNTNTNIPISTSTSMITPSLASANGTVVILDSNGNEISSGANVLDRSQIRLKVISDSGYLFDGWGQNLNCLNNDSFSSICDFIVNGDLAVNVNFIARTSPTDPAINISGMTSHNGRLYIIDDGSDYLATIHPLIRSVNRVGNEHRFGHNRNVTRGSGLASFNDKLYLIEDQYNAIYLLDDGSPGYLDGVARRLYDGFKVRLSLTGHSILSLTEHNGELLFFSYNPGTQELGLYRLNVDDFSSQYPGNPLDTSIPVSRTLKFSIPSVSGALTTINSITSYNGELYILGGDGKLYRADFTNSQILEVGRVNKPSSYTSSNALRLNAITSHNGQLYLAAEVFTGTTYARRFFILNVNAQDTNVNTKVTAEEVNLRTINLTGGVTASQPDLGSASGHQVIPGELIVFTRQSNTSRFTGACTNTELTCELVIPLTGSSTINIGAS